MLSTQMTEEERYRLLVEAITDYAVYMLDKNGIISSWNPGAERFKGYQASEIIGQHFSRFYTPEDKEAGLPARALATAASEGRFESEGWRVRKDGTRFWTHVVIDPIWSPGGDLIGYAKITRDLTERLEAQRKLEETREELVHAQKLEAIGQLTGGVAHDFNNLLMVISSSLDLMRKRLPSGDERLASLVANAAQAAQRGAALTQRMLSFARRQELELTVIDFGDLVGGMVELLQRSLGPSIRIETDFPSDLPNVFADASQLESAVLNLSVNARDAMPDGGRLLLAAEAVRVDDGDVDLRAGEYVRFTVEDQGEGMDTETLARAAEPFFTTKGIGKGTGLGLSMVHGFAEQSGGRFRLRSKKGVGTTAELWLPVLDASHERPVMDALPANKAADQRQLLVLAVDDDPLVLMNSAAMLEDLGHTVLEAHSGREALELLRKHQNVDLVITDQAMPDMTGTKLIGLVRAERPELRTILATGYAELPEDAANSQQRLNKPFSQEQLARAVNEAGAMLSDPGSTGRETSAVS